MTDSITKLKLAPLPIDRVAYRVTRKAKAEDLWRPMPKAAAHLTPVGAILKTKPLPHTAPKEMLGVVGRRRGRMTVVGYAADQGSQNNSARWVVRCDCGNLEHRTKILRWLGTDAMDMCRECYLRAYKLKQGADVMPREKAERRTAPKSNPCEVAA